MLKRIRDVWRGLALPKHEKLPRRKSIRFSKRKFRVHRVSSPRKWPGTGRVDAGTGTGITRRMDPYDRMTVNVNESARRGALARQKNAKGCDSKNPVSSAAAAARSLSGHCSTSTTNFNRPADRETPATAATEKPWPDEREIDVTDRSDSAKKVEQIVAAECQSASARCPPSSRRADAALQPMSVSLPRPKHMHVPVVKKSCHLKAQNLRYQVCVTLSTLVDAQDLNPALTTIRSHVLTLIKQTDSCTFSRLSHFETILTK